MIQVSTQTELDAARTGSEEIELVGDGPFWFGSEWGTSSPTIRTYDTSSPTITQGARSKATVTDRR